MTTTLGLDVGTSGVKAVLLTAAQGVAASAQAPLQVLDGLPVGYSEQHPADWLHAIRVSLASLRDQVPAEFAAIEAVGVSGQQHGLVALDAAEEVLRPAILWNDVRCAAECAEIVASLGGPAGMFEATGLAALPPGFTAGKVRWLWRHEPHLFARLARVMLPHDFVNHWLTGERFTETGDASGTGWLDVRSRTIHEGALAAVAPDLQDKLPWLLAAGSPGGTVRASLAEELGLSRRVVVAAGGGDNMMAAIGAGAVRDGVAVLSLGTSGTIFARSGAPVCDPSGEIAPFCDSAGAWLPLGCTMNATVATEVARKLFGMPLPDFERAVADAKPGSNGVRCIPFFTGERSPDLPTASGSWFGLRPGNTSAATLARAAMEGATFALARLGDRLGALGLPLKELRVTGGGSRSATWLAVVANSFGLPVATGVHPDAAAVGAAVQASWTLRRAHGESDLTIAAARDVFGLDRELVHTRADDSSIAQHAELRRDWEDLLARLIPHWRNES
ncbi:MAG: xylulokinase [Planctomycetota bacterium]